MLNSLLNWTSRVAIAGRIAEHRRPHDTDEVDSPWRLPPALRQSRRHKSHKVVLAGLHHLKERTALPFGERGQRGPTSSMWVSSREWDDLRREILHIRR